MFLNGHANISQLSRNWLSSLSPVLAQVRYLTLELVITKTRSGKKRLLHKLVKEPESLLLCNYIHEAMPHLIEVIFYLHIREKEVNLAINSPAAQAWVRACRTVAGGKEMERTKTFLITVSSYANISWDASVGHFTKWQAFNEARKTFLAYRMARGNKDWLERLSVKESQLQQLFQATGDLTSEA